MKLHNMQRRVAAENTCLRNHLLSVEQDSEIVDTVKDFAKLPVFANLRNGVWYSASFEGACYFKSTDGHESTWNFSLSRMNLDFAKALATHGGAIVVDSTRRGKRFPDSMNATIPMWCAVINEILFGELEKFSGAELLLYLPPWLAPSNAAKIRSLIPQHVASVPKSLQGMIRELLQPLLTSPLRPIWACPDEDGSVEWCGDGVDEMLDHQTTQQQEGESDNESFDRDRGHVEVGANSTANTSPKQLYHGLSFTPLILLSCSAVRSDALHAQWHSWKYIQGAGDDEENWCMGLTSELFWKHRGEILSSDDPHEVERAALRVIETYNNRGRAGRSYRDSNISSSSVDGASVATSSNKIVSDLSTNGADEVAVGAPKHQEYATTHSDTTTATATIGHGHNNGDYNEDGPLLGGVCVDDKQVRPSSSPAVGNHTTIGAAASYYYYPIGESGIVVVSRGGSVASTASDQELVQNYINTPRGPVEMPRSVIGIISFNVGNDEAADEAPPADTSPADTTAIATTATAASTAIADTTAPAAPAIATAASTAIATTAYAAAPAAAGLERGDAPANSESQRQVQDSRSSTNDDCDDTLSTDTSSQQAPATGLNTPVTGLNTPVTGLNTPATGLNTPVTGLNTPISILTGGDNISSTARGNASLISLPSHLSSPPPLLRLYAGSNKKEASSLGRNHWQQSVLPRAIDFYHRQLLQQQHVGDDRNNRSGTNNNGGNQSSNARTLLPSGAVLLEPEVIMEPSGAVLLPPAIRNDTVTVGDGTASVPRGAVTVTSSTSVLAAPFNHQPQQYENNQRLFFVICEDGLLACTVAAALLLAYHDVSDMKLRRRTNSISSVVGSVQHAINSQLVPPLEHANNSQLVSPLEHANNSQLVSPLEHANNSQLVSPLEHANNSQLVSPLEHANKSQLPPPRRPPPRSKDDVRECFAAMQLYIPLANQVPRRLMKELNIYSTPSQR